MLCIAYRQVWQSLGDMPKEQAMSEFVHVLATQCSLFTPYIKAHQMEREELERKKYVSHCAASIGCGICAKISYLSFRYMGKVLCIMVWYIDG